MMPVDAIGWTAFARMRAPGVRHACHHGRATLRLPRAGMTRANARPRRGSAPTCRRRAGIRGRRARGADASPHARRPGCARRRRPRWPRGRGWCARRDRSCGNAVESGPTVRRAGPRALRPRARASCCRSPSRGAGESRGPPTSRATKSSMLASRRSTLLRSASASSTDATVAASAAISPSTSLRAASSSNGPGPRRGWRVCARPGACVTKMPVPTRTSTRPLISSEMIASRTDVRLTPSETASSRSAGSANPAGTRRSRSTARVDRRSGDTDAWVRRPAGARRKLRMRAGPSEVGCLDRRGSTHVSFAPILWSSGRATRPLRSLDALPSPPPPRRRRTRHGCHAARAKPARPVRARRRCRRIQPDAPSGARRSRRAFRFPSPTISTPSPPIASIEAVMILTPPRTHLPLVERFARCRQARAARKAARSGHGARRSGGRRVRTARASGSASCCSIASGPPRARSRHDCVTANWAISRRRR